ncbi:MAG: hypothetical protein ABI045_02020 [Flavobacteriales bacterium]
MKSNTAVCVYHWSNVVQGFAIPIIRVYTGKGEEANLPSPFAEEVHSSP